MLHKCANSSCRAQFRYLNQGRLFEVEIQYSESPSGDQCKRCNDKRQIMWCWLCNLCEASNTLRFDPGRGLVTVSSLGDSACAVATTISQLSPKAAASIARVLIRTLDLDWKTLGQTGRHHRTNC